MTAYLISLDICNVSSPDEPAGPRERPDDRLRDIREIISVRTRVSLRSPRYLLSASFSAVRKT
jgi:hypothetical protein